MTWDEAINQFGLPASADCRDEIIHLLKDELEREDREAGDQELIKTFCVQLFSIGVVDDALLIWTAKTRNFDTMCGLDVQFLCGAGLQNTQKFLANSNAVEALDALDYLRKCEQSGDFLEWSPSKWVAYYRGYFWLDP